MSCFVVVTGVGGARLGQLLGGVGNSLSLFTAIDWLKFLSTEVYYYFPVPSPPTPSVLFVCVYVFIGKREEKSLVLSRSGVP